MPESDKPVLLVCCPPIPGHITPILPIAKALFSLGYPVTFLTGAPFESLVCADGLSFSPLSGHGAAWEGPQIQEVLQRRDQVGPGLPTFAFNCEEFFLKPIAAQHESIQRALSDIAIKFPNSKVVLISESWFFGSLPGMLMARGRRPTAYVSLGITCLSLSSVDHPPFGMGQSPDPPSLSPATRTQYIKQTQEFQSLLGPQQNSFLQTLDDLGAEKTPYFFLDATARCPDRYLQMCIPSLEYPRSDAPANLRFTGGLRPEHRRTEVAPEDQPTWWEELMQNAKLQGEAKKRVVAVTQGTVRPDYSELLLPTLQALSSRDDIIAIGILGARDASLPPATEIPSNARIATFIPYDALLPFCDVFVTNGGYGSFLHAVGNGVPIVVAGDTEDKVEISARVAWCGVGVNLKTGKPSVEALRDAINEVLTDTKYKQRALVLMREMDAYDPIKLVVENIEEVLQEKMN